jgi:hypothetical protein
MTNEMTHSNHGLEQSLDEILSPVHPKEKYMQNLYLRLKTKPEITVEYSKFPLVISLISTGLFLGAFILWVLSQLNWSKHRN